MQATPPFPQPTSITVTGSLVDIPVNHQFIMKADLIIGVHWGIAIYALYVYVENLKDAANNNVKGAAPH